MRRTRPSGEATTGLTCPEIGQPTADLIDVSDCQRYVGQPGGARGPLPFGDLQVGPESEQLDHPAARCNQLHRGHVDGIEPQNAVDDRSALLRPTVFREPEPMAPEAEKSDSANIRSNGLFSWFRRFFHMEIILI